MSEKQELNIPLARELCSAENAQLAPGFDSTDAVLLGDGELQCIWPEATPREFPMMQEYIGLYTDTSNTDPLKYVDDPKISQQVFPGRYRQAFTRVIEGSGIYAGKTLLVRVLRKGYIEKLVENSDLLWAEARLGENRNLPGDSSNDEEEYLTINFPNVSPDKVRTIVQNIKGLGVNTFNPIINGVSYGSADWHRIFCNSRIENDGSATITLIVGHPEFTMTAYANWLTWRSEGVTYHWNVPKQLAQAIVDAFKAKGHSASVSKSDSDGLVDIVLRENQDDGATLLLDASGENCSFSEVTSYHWGIADPSTVNYSTPADGVTADKSVRKNGDGTSDVVIKIRTTTYRNRSGVKREVTYLNVELEEVDQGVTDESITDISTVSQGTIKTQDIRYKPDCANDVITRLDTATERTFPARTINDSVSSTDTAIDIRNIITVPSPSNSTGVLQKIRANVNRYGVYDAVTVTETSKEHTISASDDGTSKVKISDSLSKQQELLQKFNETDKPLDVDTPTVGVVQKRQITKNEDDTYNYADTTDTSKQLYMLQKFTIPTKYGDAFLQVFKNMASLTAGPIAVAQGNLVETNNNSISININADGTYDVTITEVPPRDETDSSVIGQQEGWGSQQGPFYRQVPTGSQLTGKWIGNFTSEEWSKSAAETFIKNCNSSDCRIQVVDDTNSFLGKTALMNSKVVKKGANRYAAVVEWVAAAGEKVSKDGEVAT